MVLGEIGVSSLLRVIGEKTLAKRLFWSLRISPPIPGAHFLNIRSSQFPFSQFLFALRARIFFPSLSKLVTPNGRCHVLSHSRFWQYISPLSLPTRFRRLDVTVIASFQKKSAKLTVILRNRYLSYDLRTDSITRLIKKLARGFFLRHSNGIAVIWIILTHSPMGP